MQTRETIDGHTLTFYVGHRMASTTLTHRAERACGWHRASGAADVNEVCAWQSLRRGLGEFAKRANVEGVEVYARGGSVFLGAFGTDGGPL
jgi:hypothetical protein